MPTEPKRASSNRFAATATHGAQRASASPVEPETDTAEPVERQRRPGRAKATGTRASLYLDQDVAANLIAAVDDIAWRLRISKGSVYTAIVAAGMVDLEAIEQQVTPR
jgi:uncharacterized protein (DUF4415 family)